MINEGQKLLEGVTNEGNRVAVPTQVTEVKNTLFSVRDIKGDVNKPTNMVLFGVDRDHAVINKKTGQIVYEGGKDAVVSTTNYQRTNIIDNGRDYTIDIWMRKPESKWSNMGHGIWSNKSQNNGQQHIRTLREDELYAPF